MTSTTDAQGFDLECSHITKRFGDFTAVNDISFQIPKGSFFSILGPSGCGKTTLLRMMAGFLEPDEGDLSIKGKSMVGVPPNKRPVNMVFQHLALFPMMTVAENIAYGLKRKGTPKSEIAGRVQSALDRINLPDAGPKRVDQLSGGQKQRIAIARCLVLEPTVLLLDEPLGALDLKLREHMKVELKQLQHQFETTFIYITHDQSEALVMSDRVAVMNNGVFEQVGSPQDLYYNPGSAFVAGFVGDTNRWRGTIKDMSGKDVSIETRDGLKLTATAIGDSLAKGQKVDLFVRPESVALSRTQTDLSGMENTLSGKVESLLFNGANSRVLVRDPSSGDKITVTLPQTGEFNDLQPGQDLHLGWRLAQAKCFEELSSLPDDMAELA